MIKTLDTQVFSPDTGNSLDETATNHLLGDNHENEIIQEWICNL
jgi:hypothetical protein